MEFITSIVKLNLRLQCESTVCIHICEGNNNKLQKQEMMMQQNKQMKELKEYYLNFFEPLTEYISEINSAQIDSTIYLDVVMPMCNLI